eukprot:PRCOL_00003421-RA
MLCGVKQCKTGLTGTLLRDWKMYPKWWFCDEVWVLMRANRPHVKRHAAGGGARARVGGGGGGEGAGARAQGGGAPAARGCHSSLAEHRLAGLPQGIKGDPPPALQGWTGGVRGRGRGRARSGRRCSSAPHDGHGSLPEAPVDGTLVAASASAARSLSRARALARARHARPTRGRRVD